MSGPGAALDLAGSLAALQAILDVVCGIPGSITTDERGAFYFPNVGATGEVLPDGSTNTNALAKIEYMILSSTAIGADELRNEYDPNVVIPGDTYVPPGGGVLGGTRQYIHGNRQVRVQIKAETFAPTGGGAFAYAERVRTRLGLPTITDALEAAGVAVADTGDTRPADYVSPDTGRTVSVAWFEVTFNAADVAEDDPVTTIETAEADDPEWY